MVLSSLFIEALKWKRDHNEFGLRRRPAQRAAGAFLYSLLRNRCCARRSLLGRFPLL